MSSSEASLLATVAVVCLSADRTKPVLRESKNPSSIKRVADLGKPHGFRSRRDLRRRSP